MQPCGDSAKAYVSRERATAAKQLTRNRQKIVRIVISWWYDNRAVSGVQRSSDNVPGQAERNTGEETDEQNDAAK